MWNDFKAFAVRGNAIDMAVGIIIGAAFTLLVQSLVADLMMPPLSLLSDFSDYTDAFIILQHGVPAGPYASLSAAREAGATVMNYGNFLNSLFHFLVVGFSVFLLVRYLRRITRPAPAPEQTVPQVKKCSFCRSDIAVEATRCPHCTSQLD